MTCHVFSGALNPTQSIISHTDLSPIPVRLVVKSYLTSGKLEAKHVLPNINRTQAVERAEKCNFFPADHDVLTLTSKLVRARDQTRLPCEFGANPFSGFGDISHTNKNHRLTAP